MISFIIIAKDEENYIADCLRSIYAQKFEEEAEVIVVDNNSIDSTASIVKKQFPQALVVKEPVPGTNSARERGFLESKGDIIIFLDADVHLPPGWLEKVVKKLCSSKSIVAISSVYRYYDFKWYWNLANEVFIHLFIYPFVYIMMDLLGLATQMIGGNMAIKRPALLAVGGLDTKYKFFGDDTGTAFHLQKVGKVVFSPKYWVYSSARRYNKRGVFHVLAVYLLNYFCLAFTKKPWHGEGYEEVR